MKQVLKLSFINDQTQERLTLTTYWPPPSENSTLNNLGLIGFALTPASFKRLLKPLKRRTRK